MIGQMISHYRIMERLGEGGMGVVYAAEDTRIQRTVAVKFLPRDVTAVEGEYDRILYEARAAGQLNHPNICTIFAVEDGDHERFIVMEYVQGRTLKELIQSEKLSPGEALDYAIQIAEALDEAHSKEIVHRDIKPDNIMVNERGQVKVMDFGLAKLKGTTRLTKTGTTVGTLGYMAPEQIDGRGADARTDIFSLGIVLYELLSGQYPFRGEHEAAIVYSIMNEDPQPLPESFSGDVSALRRVLARALEKDPEARYQTVRDMLIDMRHVREDPSGSTGAMVASVVGRAKIERRTRAGFPFKAVGIAAGIVAVAGGVAFYFSSLFPGATSADPPIPIAVISFDNHTGESAYDYLRSAIPNLLITSLEQSPSLQVTPWERMRDVMRQRGKGDVHVIDRDLGFDICRRDTVPFIVIGSVTKAGNVFATNVTVIDVRTKRTLSSASSRGEGAGSILQYQIDQLSSRIAEGIGLSASQFSDLVQPVSNVTTSSMGAYDYYIKGREARWERLDPATARRMLEKAIELDSTFALAYAELAGTLVWLNMADLSRNAIEMAMRHAHRAGTIDRLYIEAEYERDRQKKTRIYERILRAHPRDKEINLTLGDHYLGIDNDRALIHYERALEADPQDTNIFNALGYVHFYKEDFEKALAYFERYASYSPDNPNPFDSKGEVYFRMGWLDHALNNFTKAIELNRDFFASYMRASYVHALREQYGEAMGLIDSMLSVAPTPGLQGETLVWKAFYCHWLGRDKEALQYVSQVKKLGEASGNRGLSRGADLLVAWIRYERNEFREGRVLLDSWEHAERNEDRESQAWRRAYCLMARALFDVNEGKDDSARVRLEEFEALLPHIKQRRTRLLFFRDELLSEIFLLRKDYSKCIELAKKTVVGPLTHISPFLAFSYNHPFQADRLARAYEMTAQNDDAIAEYERLITFDPRSDNRRLINPLYRYRLGMLYEKRGRAKEAVEQYERFVEVWKNADNNHLELPDARSRLRRLKGGT